MALFTCVRRYLSLVIHLESILHKRLVRAVCVAILCIAMQSKEQERVLERRFNLYTRAPPLLRNAFESCLQIHPQHAPAFFFFFFFLYYEALF